MPPTFTYKEQLDQYQSLQPGVVTKARKCTLFSCGCAHNGDRSELDDVVAPGMLQEIQKAASQQAGKDANENE